MLNTKVECCGMAHLAKQCQRQGCLSNIETAPGRHKVLGDVNSNQHYH